MSKLTILSAAIAAALVAATPVHAQTKTNIIPADTFFIGQTENQYFAKDRLIGANIVNRDGQAIGDIEDVMLNTKTNEIVGVLVGTGGVLGMGEKKIAVRYSALKFVVKDGSTVITVPGATKDVIAALEPFKRSEKKSLYEKAKDRVKGIADRTKQDAGPALEKAKEAGAAALEKSKELGQAAIDKSKEVIDAAKDKAAPPAETPAKQ